jgi:CheY-like chemotaxis protein
MVQQAGCISPHNIHSRRHRPAHVLLVDDDPALLEALAGTLQLRLGHFTLDTCDTGMKALARVTAKHYDTIITDVNMPGMNGLEFLTQVRQVRPKVLHVIPLGPMAQYLFTTIRLLPFPHRWIAPARYQAAARQSSPEAL